MDVFLYCSRLADVFYARSEEQWQNITIGSGNTELTSASIHYNSSGPAEASSVTLAESSKTLAVGVKYQIRAAVLPADAADKSLTYASSNPSAASVSAGGEVTAAAAGAFAKCKNLKTVKFTGTAAPSIAKNAFKGSGVKKVIVSKQLKKNKAFLKAIQAAGIKVKKLS